MRNLIQTPLIVLAVSFLVMWISARIGAYGHKWFNLDEDTLKDLDLIVPATLTLLGLIIGFSFSMAISRYDQRKTYEEGEANAIGTEYFRAGMLPSTDAANVRALLRKYLDQRVLFYETRNENALGQVDATTAKLQTELWSAVEVPAVKQPTPVLALVASGIERCAELAGIHAGRVVEPNPTRGMVSDDGGCHLFQSLDRLFFARHESKRSTAGSTVCSMHRVLRNCRH